MRAVILRAALLASIALLASVSAAYAQDDGDPSTPRHASPQAGHAVASSACSGYRTTPDTSAYGYDHTACGSAASSAGDRRCTSLYMGYHGLQYGTSSPFFAPGGEAYSYAGYGASYSPYAAEAAASTPSGGNGTNGIVATQSLAPCTSSVGYPGTLGASGTWPSRDHLSLMPPSRTAIQRGTDPQDSDVWLIETRGGSFIGRFHRDGNRIFFPAPEPAIGQDTAWRPWAGADRPDVDRMWQSFAAWWTAQGNAWPPN
jgi:hypothetical protein